MASFDQPPKWPSLYNPGLEVLNVPDSEPIQPGGAYIHHPSDVFRFTLYWTLLFNTPLFFICGAYAFWNYTIPPSTRLPRRSTLSTSMNGDGNSTYQLVPIAPASPVTLHNKEAPAPPSKLPRINERRSRVAFAVIVLLTFLVSSLAGSVVASAVLGFAATGMYRAGDFNMSTWTPFLLAVLQTLIGLLSIWPSIIKVI
ncbi:hypothetical protein FA15DRAFT_621191 [Coprinopsis marcescibilis]|uniref:Integral membrane protein n=1 Tax=Coprinopsis marcescibilis TaxID=230819 RepID=A0A5C3KRY2_COPMA|nr:hypothetical protein FA15DRAFT_621191 [Coprinopsis marcescibilis]